MKKLIYSFLCVVLILTFIGVVLSQSTKDYEDILNKFYKTRLNDPKIVESWALGLMQDFNVKLDHIRVCFKAIDSKPSPEIQGNIWIAGELQIVVCGFKNDSKVRVEFIRLMALELDKEGKVLRSIILDQTCEGVRSGWDGIDI